MGEIPEDILTLAKETLNRCMWERSDGICHPDKAEEKAIGEIAKAIYAERQRCAKIARDLKIEYHTNQGAPRMEKAVFAIGAMAQRDTISQAILADKEES